MKTCQTSRKKEVIIHKKWIYTLITLITEITTAYKITQIQSQLAELAKIIIGDYKCGFVKERSIIDAIYLVKQIM